MLRVLDGSSISDHRSRKDMLDKFDMLSVNQLSAQIKLVEAWKAMQNEDYPVKMRVEKRLEQTHKRTLRPSTIRDMVEGGKTTSAQSSFVRDAGKLWNQGAVV